MSMLVKQFATAAAHQNHKVTLTHRCYGSTMTRNLSAPASVIQATNISFSPPPPLPPKPSSSFQLNSKSLDASSMHNKTSGSQQFSSATSLRLNQENVEAKYEDETSNKNSSREWLINFDELQELASRPPTPVRLADMYKYANMPGQRLGNARFLNKELKIRIAQRAVDLLTLPHGLNLAAPIQNVAHTYLLYLRRFLDSPEPTTMADDDEFSELLKGILLDPTSIPMEIARGISTWRDDRQEDLGPKEAQELEDALVRFFTARVGLRLLTEHHILSSPKQFSTTNSERLLRNCKINKSYANGDSRDTEIGCIRTKYDPVMEVRKVAAEVTRQTMDVFGVCPEIDIRDCSSSTASNFTYVPHHMQYMLLELLKNSCKATVLKHHQRPRRVVTNSIADNSLNGDEEEKYNNESELPSIRVVIAKAAEDVSIQISDRGGGVPRSIMNQILQFGYVGKNINNKSSNNIDDDIARAILENSDFGKDIITGDRMRGFGLPLARIYARYFGGELTLKSMEGYGTDAYLYLPRLGDACENLPLSVRASPGGHTSLPSPSFSKRSNNGSAPTHSRRTNQLERESRRRYMLEILSQRAL